MQPEKGRRGDLEIIVRRGRRVEIIWAPRSYLLLRACGLVDVLFKCECKFDPIEF